jgi:hypothetical protein
MNHIFPIEIWQNIFDYCDFKDKLKLQEVCKAFTHLRIYEIPYMYSCKLTDDILSKYIWLTKLDAYVHKVTNVNHMTNLKILFATGGSGIDDNGIKDLNLAVLDVWGNTQITNLNHMTNLKILSAQGYNGINNNSIKDLNLNELYCTGNDQISQDNSTTLKIYNRCEYVHFALDINHASPVYCDKIIFF